MRGTLNRILFADPVLKIFSVLLGCALFLLVRDDRIRELEIAVPVVIGEVGDTRILTSPVPTSLRVRVRGRWSNMIQVLEGKPTPYEVDVSGLQDGDTYAFLRSTLTDSVGVQGLSVVNVEPPDFQLRIEERLTRVVPVEVLTVGEVPEDFVVDPGAISFEPRTVRVTGPVSAVQDINTISSYPIALDGLRRDLRADIWLKRPNQKYVSLGADQITVEIAVYEREGETQIEGVPVFVDNCPPEFVCSTVPQEVDMTVRGSLPRTRRIESQREGRWLVVNASEYPAEEKVHRIAMLFARPFEGVVLVPEPRSVQLRIQRVEEPTGLDTETESSVKGKGAEDASPDPGEEPADNVE